MHALRPLAADALAEQDDQPRAASTCSATCGRSGSDARSTSSSSHDAVMYLASEDDLRACMGTAFAHTRPGGVALFVPDCTRETFAPGTDHGGHDGADGRALRYLEWTTDPDPGDTTFEVDYAVVLHEPGQPSRLVHDHHVNGLFPEHTWLHLLEQPGSPRGSIPGDPKDEDRAQPLFVARRRAEI